MFECMDTAVFDLAYFPVNLVEGLYIVYVECQSVCPFVIIGSPRPLPRKRACASPPRSQVGGDTLACGGGEGHNSDEGTTVYVSTISIIPLRVEAISHVQYFCCIAFYVHSAYCISMR